MGSLKGNLKFKTCTPIYLSFISKEYAEQKKKRCLKRILNRKCNVSLGTFQQAYKSKFEGKVKCGPKSKKSFYKLKWFILPQQRALKTRIVEKQFKIVPLISIIVK